MKFCRPHFSIIKDVFSSLLSHMLVQYKTLGYLKNGLDRLKVVSHFSDYPQSSPEQESMLGFAGVMLHNVCLV